jgi:hypothetical protein
MKNFENLLSLYLDKQDELDKRIIKNIAYLAYKEGRYDERYEGRRRKNEEKNIHKKRNN